VKNFFSFQRLISAAKKRKYGWGKHEKRKKSSRRAVELRPFSTRIALDRLKSNSVVIAGGGSGVRRDRGFPGGRGFQAGGKHVLLAASTSAHMTSRHVTLHQCGKSEKAGWQGDSEILYRIKNQNSLRTL